MDIEEHTRELQIEVALQTLQRGLEYQKNGDYLNARRKYDELGRIEIIQMVNSTNNPTIDSLKYLCFRNRGMLRLRELIDNSIKTNNGNPSVNSGGDSHKEKVNDYGDDDVGISVYGEFLGAMNDLLNAVSFGTPDDKIIIILASLFEHFGYLRLSRLCYELKTINDDILLINDAKLIDGYLKLLSNLNVHNRVYSKLKDKIERSLFWKNRNEFKSYDWDKLLTLEAWENERCDALKEELVIEVDVNDGIVNIDHLLGEFVGCLPKPKGRGKCYDGYTLTGKTIDKVEFEFHFKNTEPIRSEDTNDSVEKPHSERKMEDLDLPEKNDAVLTASDSGNQVINDTVRSRVLRTKNEDDQNDQLKNSLERLNNFASVTLPSFLKTCNININFPSLVNLILYEDECGIDLMTRKFYSCIKSWDDDFTQCLSVTGDNKKKNNESVREILNINSSKVINHSKYTTADVVSLKPFLDSMNSGGMHFNEIRMHVLEYLFNSKYICFNNMSKASLRNLKSIVDSVSINYFNQMEKSVNIGETIDSRMLNIAVSIFELLVDSFLEQSKEQKLKITKSSNLLQDPYSSENILINRINKWSSIIEDMLITDQTIGKSEVWCRFKWFQLLYLQSCPSHIKTQILTDLLTDLIDVIRSNELYLPYVNFELVPVLSYESISTQHSKLSILQMFDSNDKSNEILENILLGLPNPTLNDDPAKSQLEKFTKLANLQMKLRLWCLLLRFYRIENQIEKYKLAFEKVLNIMTNELHPDSLIKLSPEDQNFTILTIVGFFNYFSTKFIEFADECNFTCFQPTHRQSSSAVLSFIGSLTYCLYSFLMYQKSVQVSRKLSLHTVSVKSYEILMNAISCCLFLACAYYPSALTNRNEEYINDFMSLCHVELGLRHKCMTLNGTFLKFLQLKLLDLDINISCTDFFQVIHCRFGMPVSLDKFDTFDHKCKPKSMTVEDSEQLSQYISKYCYKGKHPAVSPPKSDIKSIIDKIVQTVEPIQETDPASVQNRKIFNNFLKHTSIDMEFIIACFQGDFELDFKTPDGIFASVAKNGMYYLQGIVGLNLVNSRKRNAYLRSSELELIQKTLEKDIQCGCNLFETWVALGQIYSYLVEYDLIWTADKLNSIERKHQTAFTQKKALLCYFNAINTLNKLPNSERSKASAVLPGFWESLGKELYAAWREPMNKRAFHVKPKEDKNDQIIYLASNDIPHNAISKLLDLAFKNAYELNRSSWFDLMYLAKSELMLQYVDVKSKLIVESLLKACTLSLDQSNKEDPILEPHYYLFTIVGKLLKRGIITEADAIQIYKDDDLFVSIFEGEESTDFPIIAKKMLEKMIDYDKKKWQHKPVYKLAKWYHDVEHNNLKAKEEMLKLVNLKANVRALSTIWKPNSERPGKHYIYNSIYTQFLVDILYELGDIYSLSILVKKMRRAGSTMVNLTKTFDAITLRTCSLLKKSLKIEPGYLDNVISKIKFADFLKYSNEYIETLRNTNIFDDNMLLHFYFLSETHNFRKLATGFGATGVIDESFHSIYMLLFMPYLTKRIIAEEFKGLPAKYLLEKSKKFSVDKILKPKQSTPDATNFPEGPEIQLDPITGLLVPVTAKEQTDEEIPPLEEFSKVYQDIIHLPLQDQLSIISYLSFSSLGSDTPAKDKIKVARRDVTPFATKVVNITQSFVDELKERTEDGKSINYGIEGPFTEKDLMNVNVGVSVKTTKENKEDWEFNKLTSAHDRSFTAVELSNFNKILDTYGVTTLENPQTNSEVEVEKMRMEGMKQEEANQNGNVVSVYGSKSAQGLSNNSVNHEQESKDSLHKNNEISSLPDHEINDTPISTTPLFPSSAQESGVNTWSAQSGMDVNNPFHSPSKTNAIEGALLAQNTSVQTTDDLPQSMSVTGNSNAPITKILPEHYNKNADPANNEECSKHCEETKNIITGSPGGSEKLTPSKPVQSKITSFFKLTPSRESDFSSMASDGGASPLKRKMLEENTSAAKRGRYYFDTDDISHSNAESSEHSMSSSPRRNSRRSVCNPTLFELGKDGVVKEQKDIKTERAKQLAEVITSGDEEENAEQSVIIID